MSEATESNGALFELGFVVSTPGAIAALEKDEVRASPSELLARHVHGDWGDLDAEDAKNQRRTLEPGVADERIISSYILEDGVKVWIITEWDRSATTLLLPSEY